MRMFPSKKAVMPTIMLAFAILWTVMLVEILLNQRLLYTQNDLLITKERYKDLKAQHAALKLKEKEWEEYDRLLQRPADYYDTAYQQLLSRQATETPTIHQAKEVR